MISSKIIANGIIRALFTIVAIALLLFVLYKIQSIIIYLIVAFIVTLISNPFVEFLKQKLKFKNTIAVITTIFLMFLVFFGFILTFLPLISSQGKNLSLLDTNSIQTATIELVNNFNHYLISNNIDAGNLLKESNIASKLNLNFVPTILNSILGTLGEFGLGLASVLFITFFFLKDKVTFIIGFKRLLPENHGEKILNSLSKVNNLLSRYFIGLLLQLIIVFILYLIILLIFNVPNAFLISLLCAILNIIPYLGPLIGSILAAVLTMIGNIGTDFQTHILPNTIYVLIGFWIVQLIDNNISQPIIFSKSIKSHPLEIFLITLISGFLFGIIGMIVAIPFYTILKVFGKEFYPENKIIKLITKGI